MKSGKRLAMNIVSTFEKPRLISKGVKKVWNRVFLTKDMRFLNALKRLKTDEERLFLVKLCYSTESSLKAMMIVSKEKWYSTFASRIFDWLESDRSVKLRLTFDRIIRWMHRVGYDKEVWDSI